MEAGDGDAEETAGALAGAATPYRAAAADRPVRRPVPGVWRRAAGHRQRRGGVPVLGRGHQVIPGTPGVRADAGPGAGPAAAPASSSGQDGHIAESAGWVG